MSLPQTPSFQHKHLYLINKLSSHIRPSYHIPCSKSIGSESEQLIISIHFYHPFIELAVVYLILMESFYYDGLKNLDRKLITL